MRRLFLLTISVTLLFVLIAGALPAVAQQTITPTADPFATLSIAELAARSYGGGVVTQDQQLTKGIGFVRYQFHYPSDGLTIYGFMDVPTAAPKNHSAYPVVVMLHGYVDPKIYYGTWDYTSGYADALAQAGYLVLHPTLRNYGPSDKGPNVLRVGFAIDALNLIAIARQQGGQPGALQQADPQAIGVWGHSMGGGIAIRAMTVDPAIKAVVLYAPISGDDRLNAQRWGTRAGQYNMAVPDAVFQQTSPINFYDRIQAAISLNQGLADLEVPPAWSADLCTRLTALQKAIDCHTYPGQGHIFTGDSNQLFIQRTIAFFNTHLQAS